MGTIRERSPGHFEIRACVGRSPSGKPRYVQETYVHHRKDGGIQAARRRMAKLEAGAQEKRPTATLGVLLSDWLIQSRRKGRAPNTIANCERRVRVITEALGSVKRAELTARDLDFWYRQLLDEGRSPADVMAFHRLISAALAQGEEWDDGIRNVAKKADPPRVPRPTTHTPPIKRVQELIRLAERSKNPQMAGIIMWASLTEMRRGEICGLRWPDVLETEGRVVVQPAIWQDVGRTGVKDAKSHQSPTISIDPVALEVPRRRRLEAAGYADSASLSVDP